MRGVNKVILIGRLGADPTVRQFQNGGQVAEISLATSEVWNDKNTGERRENTEWHRVTFFGKLADIASQYLKKGSVIYVEGKLKTEKYTDNNNIERYATKIIADNLQMLGGNQTQEQGGYQQSQNGYNQPQNHSQSGYQQPQPPVASVADDDIPF